MTIVWIFAAFGMLGFLCTLVLIVAFVLASVSDWRDHKRPVLPADPRPGPWLAWDASEDLAEVVPFPVHRGGDAA